MLDGKAFGTEIVGIVRDFVSRSVEPLQAQLTAVEQRVSAIPVPVDAPKIVADVLAQIPKQADPVNYEQISEQICSAFATLADEFAKGLDDAA